MDGFFLLDVLSCEGGYEQVLEREGHVCPGKTKVCDVCHYLDPASLTWGGAKCMWP